MQLGPKMERENKPKIQTPKYYNLILFIWALLLVIIVLLTYVAKTSDKNRNYDLQYEASELSLKAMELIKERKQELGSPIEEEDYYETGLLGPKRTKIQTTEGDTKAKRTSTNPNFAAVYIEMFQRAGLKENDEIAIITSGSFPALNISAVIASQVYGLKIVTMTGIGASSYGATDVNFNYFDMAEYLFKKEVFKKELDFVSFGGSNDVGGEFADEVKENILARINETDVFFINEEDFKTNVRKRLQYIYDKCPNVKLLLNVGGSLVSMGSGYTSAINFRGLVEPTYLTNVSSSDSNHKGLLEIFLENDLPIIQMLNITKIAYEYGLPQDPSFYPKVGEGDVYKEASYNIVIPIIGLITSTGLLVFYFITRKKYGYI